MIEPYASVIREFEGQLKNIGFAITNDSEYGIIFHRDQYRLELSTEKYYHPSLMACLVNKKGVEYEMGILRETLSPKIYFKDTSELDEIRSKCGVNLDITKEEFINEYLRKLLSQLVNFLDSFKDTLFDDKQVFESAYKDNEIAKMKKFGMF